MFGVDGCVAEVSSGGIPGGVRGDLDLFGDTHGRGIEQADSAADCTRVDDKCSMAAALVGLE